MGRVAVVVLGDLGRSPRMQYHALSLLEHGHEVLLVGYHGTALPTHLSSHPKLQVAHLTPCPRLPSGLAGYILKTLWQCVTLLLSLPLLSHLSHILVQTPPGVPNLPILWLYSTIRGCNLIVDFHNYSHTILSLSTGVRHPLVHLTHLLEGISARWGATDSFCVTRAMQEDLANNWNIKSTVLYDRPPDKFRPISHLEKHQLMDNLSSEYPEFIGSSESGTVFTTLEGGEVNLLEERPGLIVSSTSWTEDEDFSVLLDSLVRYEKRLVEEKLNLPKLIVVITGKGPQKDHYLTKIKDINLQHVSFVTPWLETDDYPKMLASADLGVCLHTSSSGLDLPMKVVDMFGCGLPVAAVQFPAIGELVIDGVNGSVFKDSDQLSDIIVDWFTHFPRVSSDKHQQFRTELEKFRNLGWEENWDKVALKAFMKKEIADSFLSNFVMVFFFVFVFLTLSSFLPVVG